MHLHSPYPYFLLKSGLLHEYPSLYQELETECLVIGGGISGALAAWHLAKAGIAVVVVDRRHIGMGSTCASTSLLQYEIDVPLYQLAEMEGEKVAARAYWLCIEAVAQLEEICRQLPGALEFERKPSLYFASRRADVKEIDREFELRSKHGIPVERLSAAEVEQYWGFSSPAALLSEKNNAQVDAYALTHALLRDAVRLGAQVFDKTEIVEIRHRQDRVELRTDRKVRITAKKLIIAAGYESFCYLEGMPQGTRLRSTYALVSEPYEQETLWHGNALLWETARPYLYLRTTGDRRILVGGRDEPFYDPQRRDRLLGKKTAALSRDFEKLFPGLGPLRVDFNWAGTFVETKNGLPFIGAIPKRPNTWLALGCGGNGITFSQIAALVIRDKVLGKKEAWHGYFDFR